MVKNPFDYISDTGVAFPRLGRSTAHPQTFSAASCGALILSAYNLTPSEPVSSSQSKAAGTSGKIGSSPADALGGIL
ncbi:MAG: hypothetical protein IKO27_06710 [Ruminococcus sp.]|nr:hypothetical protein [Ruminococcus sp.]